jgi:hypothetical protein
VTGSSSSLELALSDTQVFVASGRRGLGILDRLPFFTSATAHGGSLALNWEGPTGTRLQHAVGVAGADWQDVVGLDSTKQAVLPIEASLDFSRLVRP